MKLKSIFVVLVCIVVLLSGCKATSNKGSNELAGGVNTSSEIKEDIKNDDKNSKQVISVACSITDSFNPYNAKTPLNRNLSTLLYESLISLDESFTPQYRLASKVTVKGKTATVSLRTATFSDGSNITADDVVYCANKAMESETRYGYALGDVSEVSAASYNTVVFTLKKEDPYFINQLDFPIFKKNSDKKTSSDNLEIPPVSSGAYTVDETKLKLNINKYYYGEKPNVSTVNLINTPDGEALEHNLQIGNISYHYSDLSDCKLLQVRGSYKKVNSNNLVYLGANMASGIMSNGEMRQAVSAALDREAITNTAYYQNAVPTSNAFHPAWAKGNNITAINQNTINENVYLALLEEMGYNGKDKSGYYVNSAGERLSLRLVCYKENAWRLSAADLIKKQLKVAGVDVKVQSYSWSDYTFALKNGHFDMYLAEVSIGNNMDITELVTKGGSAAYGISYSNKIQSSDTSSTDAASSQHDAGGLQEKKKKNHAGDTARAVSEMYNGNATITEVATAFLSEMPIIPICYRTGMVSYASDISGISTSITDVYGGIKSARFK